VFAPSRLTLARQRRGLTKRALAAHVGVSGRIISAYEADAARPDGDTLQALAEALVFPTDFFTAEDLEEIPEAAASFRSLARMTAAQRHAARAAGTLGLALSDWIDARFRLPTPAVPRLGPGVDPETAAEVVRAEWRMGLQPVRNLLHLLEARGIRVFSLAQESREVDAFSFWRGSQPFVFLNTTKTAEHSRMDAAHELGHLVLHWHHASPQGKEAEREAQAFAGAFLMPSSTVAASAPRSVSLGSIMKPKRHWRVAATAYVYRLYKVGAISEWHYRTLMVELSKRGFRVAEPHPLQRETSQVLSKVFTALRKQGITQADVARFLHIFPRDLDALVFGLTIVPVRGEGTVDGEPSADQRPQLRLVSGS
jgi:Zn-dependent peptidase ImmA (M78 family)/transcriptional regulator with XRE-family HTH domain